MKLVGKVHFPDIVSLICYFLVVLQSRRSSVPQVSELVGFPKTILKALMWENHGKVINSQRAIAATKTILRTTLTHKVCQPQDYPRWSLECSLHIDSLFEKRFWLVHKAKRIPNFKCNTNCFLNRTSCISINGRTYIRLLLTMAIVMYINSHNVSRAFGIWRMYLYVCEVCLYFLLSLCPTFCLSVSLYLYVSLFFPFSQSMSLCMNVCLYVCMHVCLSVYLSVCLYVCMYVSYFL